MIHLHKCSVDVYKTRVKTLTWSIKFVPCHTYIYFYHHVKTDNIIDYCDN